MYALVSSATRRFSLEGMPEPNSETLNKPTDTTGNGWSSRRRATPGSPTSNLFNLRLRHIYIPSMPTKYNADYYLTNQERQRESMKRCYYRQREERIAKQLEYYRANKDQINAKRRERRAAARTPID
ncbi:hypothetical protein PHYPSEUDO_002392 [Phytophthora pseudosyringae]|uniref:Uncharacterized protein n=1 Tax=Phytophthora pseudosyringae TaxID=221518 RepID=A0A8T1V4F0_9STRA|nr:hypothetical protein PHYPSEUDO_002392 [Phytophthora pseudosyringae]